jgi:hypothetical protein
MGDELTTKTCATCCNVKIKARTRKFAKTNIDGKGCVYYCGLSGAEVLSAMKGCCYWNKTVITNVVGEKVQWEQASL